MKLTILVLYYLVSVAVGFPKTSSTCDPFKNELTKAWQGAQSLARFALETLQRWPDQLEACEEAPIVEETLKEAFQIDRTTMGDERANKLVRKVKGA